MKKIFLLFAIATFSSASAQQNDLFDIQKHIQKKIVRDKENAGIKAPLISRSCIWGPLNRKAQSKYIKGFILPNGDKVITLSIDNMPCVVPDMNLFKTMPNPVYNWNSYGNNLIDLRQRQTGQIPNGAMPHRMIVSK